MTRSEGENTEPALSDGVVTSTSRVGRLTRSVLVLISQSVLLQYYQDQDQSMKVSHVKQFLFVSDGMYHFCWLLHTFFIFRF